MTTNRTKALLASMLASCAPPGAAAIQSIHDPASAAAAIIDDLAIAMYGAAAAITLLVLALVFRAVFGPPRPARSALFVLGGGIVFPVAALSVLLIACVLIGNALSRPLPAPVARIQVIGHQWWWEVRYLPPSNPTAELALLLQDLCGLGPAATASRRKPSPQRETLGAIVLANELRIPVGHPVEIELHTRDVIHSFWVPALGGKLDMIPGHVNRLAWQAERAGVYRGQCAEYCGGPHGMMGLVVVAEGAADYREWLRAQAAVARRPDNAERTRGQAAFLRAGCGSCHSIRGTAARGDSAPDLTHIGSRRTLAAATLDNHIGTLAGWIADPQTVKPGNRMPATTVLTGPELRAVAAYLASLE